MLFPWGKKGFLSQNAKKKKQNKTHKPQMKMEK